MKLVAQRVVTVGQATKRTGINSRFYAHPGEDWLDDPPSSLGEGSLVNSHIEVDPPRGNRVRSYLELLAPDFTTSENLRHSALSTANFLAESKEPLPWKIEHAGVLLEFSLEASLAPQWQIEFQTLLAHCLAVRTEPELRSGTLSGDIFR